MGELTALPRPANWICEGPTSKGMEWNGREGEGEGKKKKGEGGREGEEERGKVRPGFSGMDAPVWGSTACGFIFCEFARYKCT